MNDFWLIFVPRVGVHPGGKALEETLARPFLTDPVIPFVLLNLVALWLLNCFGRSDLSACYRSCRVLVAGSLYTHFNTPDLLLHAAPSALLVTPSGRVLNVVAYRLLLQGLFSLQIPTLTFAVAFPSIPPISVLSCAPVEIM